MKRIACLILLICLYCNGLYAKLAPFSAMHGKSYKLNNHFMVVTKGIKAAPDGSMTTSGGDIVNNSSAIMDKGIVWSSSILNPTTSVSTKTSSGVLNNAYTSKLTALRGGITYYVRAYASTASETVYGEVIRWIEPARMDFTSVGIKTFIVPNGITMLTIQAWSGSGGSTNGGIGGYASQYVVSLPVVSGQVFNMLVGGNAPNSPNASGGGGGTFIIRGSDPILVVNGGSGCARNMGITQFNYTAGGQLSEDDGSGNTKAYPGGIAGAGGNGFYCAGGGFLSAGAGTCSGAAFPSIAVAQGFGGGGNGAVGGGAAGYIAGGIYIGGAGGGYSGGGGAGIINPLGNGLVKGGSGGYYINPIATYIDDNVQAVRSGSILLAYK